MKTLILILLLGSFSSYAATSQEERANKQFELTVQAGVDYRFSPTQIGAMYFLDANNLLGLKVGADREGQNERQTNVSLQYKHFAGNSFYVAGEVFYLHTREDVNPFFLEVFGVPSKFAEYTSLGAGVRIGNQWTWKYFTLGCDWVGIGRRFGTFKKETDDLETTTWTLLNVGVGVSF